MNRRWTQLTSLSAVLLISTSASYGAVIFSDNFDGGSGDLHNTTPDTTTGVTKWVAGSLFNANGSTTNTVGSATLAFTPVNGFIYTLDASFSGLGLVSGADTDWFGFGFVNGQSTTETSYDRFTIGNVVGSAWMLLRGNQNYDPNVSGASGTGQLGDGNYGYAGGGFTDLNLTPITSEIDLRIVLDTTAGVDPTDWTATWSAKRAADSSYTVVRATEGLQTGAVISAVGISRSGAGITGAVESFSLTAIPEPSSAALLLGLGSIALVLRRRK